MKPAKLAEYAAIGAILLLALGRLFWFPVALFLVTGGSMLPEYRTGDLVVGVAAYAVDYSVGDVVVWFAAPTHGVIHRVANITDGYVVTKGDSNPLPDPPVPREWVKYVAVLRVPREAWVPVALALAGFHLWLRRRELTGLLRGWEEPGLRVATAVVAAFILLDIAVVLLTPVYWFSYRVVLEVPGVELARFSVENFTAAVLEYRVYHAEVLWAGPCAVFAGGASYPCSYVWFSNATFIVGIPREAYLEAYRSSESFVAGMAVSLNVTFDKGWLHGVYWYTFNWRLLAVEVANGSLRVYNPNPIPFNLTGVRAVCMDFDGLGRTVVVGEEALGDIAVGPLSAVEIRPEAGGSHCYVQFAYRYKFAEGGFIQESRRIDFGQPGGSQRSAGG